MADVPVLDSTNSEGMSIILIRRSSSRDVSRVCGHRNRQMSCTLLIGTLNCDRGSCLLFEEFAWLTVAHDVRPWKFPLYVGVFSPRSQNCKVVSFDSAVKILSFDLAIACLCRR